MQSPLPLSDEKQDLSNENIFQALLHPRDFEQISQIVYRYSGIRLNPGKEELVRSRLIKRLRALHVNSFSAYLQHIKEDRTVQELHIMIDALTTNKTSFFRENQHFEYMRNHILPELKQHGSRLRIWSAGCSSGEEPYSIAMLLQEEWGQTTPADIRILATDISTRILAKARAGEYEKESLKDVPPAYMSKYFSTVRVHSNNMYTIRDNIKRMVRFAKLNLMDEWPMKGPFEIIFCRNVMIYFDSATQGRLVRRFYNLLVPGGHLLVGHSESLVANSCGFKYVQPATYAK
ncbi:MAG: protein-glutamate O-methyltransferase CheR [Acidobacteria bacterium]|nr:protein-glutamate O-methyltransferase CheR [Acidobacteriota bacterium]